VEEAFVVEEMPNGWRVRNADAKIPGNVSVRLSGWPLDEIPRLVVGDEVDVQGLFMKARDTNQPEQYFINVKWETKDFIKLR
jgi:hypothetical protein